MRPRRTKATRLASADILRSTVSTLFVCLLSAGCIGPSAEGARVPLTVFAASSLTDVFSELERRFEEKHPDIDLEPSFGGSQVLRFQIEQGAPVDVFASANDVHMAALEAGGYVRPPHTLAVTDLVVIVPPDNPAEIHRFDQLDRAVRLVVGTEYVPIGVYAETVLENASAQLGEAFVTGVRDRVVSMESNVRLVRAKVELGEADAALVYRTDARSSDRVRMIPIPDELNVQARFTIAVTTTTDRASEADLFLSFLASPAAREVFSAHGFTGGD